MSATQVSWKSYTLPLFPGAWQACSHHQAAQESPRSLTWPILQRKWVNWTQELGETPDCLHLSCLAAWKSSKYCLDPHLPAQQNKTTKNTAEMDQNVPRGTLTHVIFPTGHSITIAAKKQSVLQTSSHDGLKQRGSGDYCISLSDVSVVQASPLLTKKRTTGIQLETDLSLLKVDKSVQCTSN